MKPMAYVEPFSQIKIKTTNKQIMNETNNIQSDPTWRQLLQLVEEGEYLDTMMLAMLQLVEGIPGVKLQVIQAYMKAVTVMENTPKNSSPRYATVMGRKKSY